MISGKTERFKRSIISGGITYSAFFLRIQPFGLD
jgi:hypothetical protein